MNLRRPTTVPARAPWWVRYRLAVNLVAGAVIVVGTALLMSITGPSDIEAEADMAAEAQAAALEELQTLRSERLLRVYEQGRKAGLAQCREQTL